MNVLTNARITTFLYDWDGTFVDSEAVNRAAKMGVFTEYLLETLPEALPLIEQLHTEGRDFGDVCRSLISLVKDVHDFQLPMPIEDLRIRKLRPAVKAALPFVELSTGIAQFVRDEHGTFKQAIVSNSPDQNILPVLDRHELDNVFPQNRVFSALTYCPKTTKPFPDIYLHAMNDLEVHPSECATFEDSITGVAAAKAASVGIIVGYIGLVAPADREKVARELRAHGATMICADFSGFRAQLNGPIITNVTATTLDL